MDKQIETIENRWDILYRDYPEVYDEFASVPYNPPVLELLHKEFNLSEQTIIDVGSGSGKSTFELARFAKHVTGVEPETAMLEIARGKLAELGLTNVEFIQGTAQHIPAPDKSFDSLTAVTTVFFPVEETLLPFVKEAQRVLRKEGLILCINIAPGWYGGDLHDVIDEKGDDLKEIDQLLTKKCRFQYKDVETVQDYKSLDKILSTYGFIFGRNAIDYLRCHNKTTILWRNRIHYKFVDS